MRINFLGVIISAIVIVLLRYLWNAHFGGADWGHFIGKAAADVQADRKAAGLELVNALVLSTALGWVIGRLRDRSLATGLGVGVLACVGFALTVVSTTVIHGAAWQSLIPEGGFYLAAYVIAGAILGAMAPKRTAA